MPYVIYNWNMKPGADRVVRVLTKKINVNGLMVHKPVFEGTDLQFDNYLSARLFLKYVVPNYKNLDQKDWHIADLDSLIEAYYSNRIQQFYFDNLPKDD